MTGPAGSLCTLRRAGRPVRRKTRLRLVATFAAQGFHLLARFGEFHVSLGVTLSSFRFP